MAYTPINVPPHPGQEPAPTATAEVWSRYLSLLSLHQVASIANLRGSGDDALAESHAALAAAQLEMAAALREAGRVTEFVFPAKNRAEMIFEVLKSKPVDGDASEFDAVADAANLVDAYINRVPGALPPA